MISIILKIHSLPAKRHEIFMTMKGLAAQMTRESSCEGAELFQDLENKDIMYMTGKWRKLNDFNTFKQKRFYSVLIGLEGLLKEPFEIRHTIQHKLHVSHKCKEL